LGQRLMEIKLPFLSIERNRHGNQVIFVHRNGRRIRLREKPGTVEFLDAYKAAIERLSPAQAPQPAVQVRTQFLAHTLGWLGVQYFASEEFQALDARSQRIRCGVLESCLTAPYRRRQRQIGVRNSEQEETPSTRRNKSRADMIPRLADEMRVNEMSVNEHADNVHYTDVNRQQADTGPDRTRRLEALVQSALDAGKFRNHLVSLRRSLLSLTRRGVAGATCAPASLD
jgi:hypothetical protein